MFKFSFHPTKVPASHISQFTQQRLEADMTCTKLHAAQHPTSNTHYDGLNNTVYFIVQFESWP